MLHITDRQKRQIGSKRLAMIAGTKLDCAEGMALLSKATAAQQLDLIERLLVSEMDVAIESQKLRVEKRADRQASTASRVKQQTTDLAAALGDVLQDEVRLASLCRWLAARGKPTNPMIAAARAVAQMVETVMEKQLTAEHRLTVARNRAALVAAGADPDGAYVSEDEEYWSRIARTQQGQRYRDNRLDARQDVEAELKEIHND